MQTAAPTTDRQRDIDSRLETLDAIVGRMNVVTTRMRTLSDRLYGPTPESDSNKAEMVPSGSMARFACLNDVAIDYVSAMEDLLAKIEEAV